VDEIKFASLTIINFNVLMKHSYKHFSKCDSQPFIGSTFGDANWQLLKVLEMQIDNQKMIMLWNKSQKNPSTCNGIVSLHGWNGP